MLPVCLVMLIVWFLNMFQTNVGKFVLGFRTSFSVCIRELEVKFVDWSFTQIHGEVFYLLISSSQAV